MIFLSHNWKDKDVVEPIAVRLKEVYGEENVFYDSWSIKPGENIIGKMNEGIENCKYFFFFISNNSLNSSMVDLEWQSALFKSAKDGIKFIPIKIDNCYPPQILISTVYIDMYSYGIENSLRDMFDIINETDSKSYNKVFNNLICKVKKIENHKFEISIEAMKLRELENIKHYMDEYRKEYSDEILESMQYSFRVFLVPQTGNHLNSSDRSVEFIKASDLNEEEYKRLKNDITLIKNRRIPVSNDDKMKPGVVVKKVQERVNFEFKPHHHTYCWKYFKVRPKSNSRNPECTDTRYCNYDAVHNDYVYTNAWVELIIKELSKEDKRNTIYNYRGE